MPLALAPCAPKDPPCHDDPRPAENPKDVPYRRTESRHIIHLKLLRAIRIADKLLPIFSRLIPEHHAEVDLNFFFHQVLPASCGFVAEPVGTRQCSPLRFDARAEERAALTEPASPPPAAQI
jgi:hypothetical protein